MGSRFTKRAAQALLLALLLAGAAAAVPALAPPEESAQPSVKDMKKFLRQAYLAGDEGGLRDILLRYARIDSRDPVRAVLDEAVRFRKSEETEDWYWALMLGAASFNRPLAFSEMGDFLLQYRKRAEARDLMHALARNRSKYVNRVFRRVLAEGPADLKLMAIDQAAQVPVRRTVDVLLGAYEKEDSRSRKSGRVSEVQKRLVVALEALTLQRLGDNYPNWAGWWAAQRHKGLKIIREEAEQSEASTAVAQPLDPVRQRQFLGLEKMPEGKVLVIKGPTARNGVDTNNDHIEDVLERLRIPHDVALKERLEDPSYEIDQYAAIFINCTQIHRFCQSPGHRGGAAVGNRLRRCLGPAPHDEFQSKMKQPALDKLERWVKRGGYLFTEDWVLIEVLSPLFSNYVAVGKKLGTATVPIQPASGQTSNPLLRGVFVPPVRIDDFDWDEDDPDDDEDEDEKPYDPSVEDDPGDVDTGGRGHTGVDPESPGAGGEELADPDFDPVHHTWVIDDESHAIDVRSKKVTVLVRSKALRESCGQPAVALTFTRGKGRVMHVLSHFGKQNSAQDEATIENLLIDFLIEVNVRMGPREGD